ncbi:PaaI family thioesterase [Microvirga sp. 0TCS3.31]
MSPIQRLGRQSYSSTGQVFWFHTGLSEILVSDPATLADLESWLILWNSCFFNEAKRVSPLTPKDPAFQARIQASFDKQGLMSTLGASILHIAPGAIDIALSPSPSVSQQHGFVHAGAVSAIADTAAGYAALSLMPPGAGVLTTEFKINLVAPAGYCQVGERRRSMARS